MVIPVPNQCWGHILVLIGSNTGGQICKRALEAPVRHLFKALLVLFMSVVFAGGGEGGGAVIGYF